MQQYLHTESLDHHYSRVLERRSFALPSLDVSLATTLSDDLLANWCFRANTKVPGRPILSFAWDIRRHSGDERGRELFESLTFERFESDEIEAAWVAANRAHSEEDSLVLHELASLYHRDLLDELIAPEDGEALREEVSSLADRFEQAQFELAKAVFEPILAETGSHLYADACVKFKEVEQQHFSRVMKDGKIPMPSNSVVASSESSRVTIDDFVAYLPMHQYIYIPTRALWPASSVNSSVGAVEVPMQAKPVPAATWLDKHRAVQCMTWAPGKEMEIRGELVDDGGWVAHPGAATFNEYRPPAIQCRIGDPSPWVDHVRRLFGEDAPHIIMWCAHRVQYPAEKINHALVLGGDQGIGKDTLLEPIKAAVGPWNVKEVSPAQMLGRFNGYVKSVVLRVSEARDLGEVNRYAFYEHLKTLTAAPPDVLRVDEKHLREHHVLNVCGVVITTNHLSNGIHLPADDRRHFVAWSSLKKEDFTGEYWDGLYGWFADGGNEIVAHYLATLDLSRFNAKAPPPKTRAFWDIVNASRAPEDAEMADAIEALGHPAAVTATAVSTRAAHGLSEFLRDRRNSRVVPQRFRDAGYEPVRNPDADSGLWRVAGKRQVVYAKRDMAQREQIAAARLLTTTSP